MSVYLKIPLALTGLRACLAPVMVLLACLQPLPWAFGVCLTLAFLSDLFDGIIARRLHIATPALRRLDSIADTIFYVAAVYAVWRLHQGVLWQHARLLGLLFGLEAARYLLDFVKFRREASYHMWSSKLWGVLLFLAFLSVLAGQPGRARDVLVMLAITIGIIADLEGMAISLVLPFWKNDVPTLWRALKMRRAMRESRH